MTVKTIPEISVRGESGATYTFKVYPWGTSFKPLGGVYLVLRQTPDHKYTVLYVGQTGDLSERFDRHHQQACFDRNNKTHIAVLIEGNEAMRFSVETDLIRAYRPPCNRTV